jgi:DNA replication protein DnaC
VPELLRQAFAQAVSGQIPWPLFVHGPPGTGKTCAGLALCDHVRRSHYVTVADLVGRVLDSFSKRAPFDWDSIRPIDWRDPPAKRGRTLLVLDELGVRANVSDTHYDVVQRVLDSWESFPLVLISNLDITRLARIYDDRIASRCEAGTVVEVKGHDRRTA